MDSNYNTAPLPGPLDIMPGLIRKYFAHVITSTTEHLSPEEETEEYPKRAAQILLRWGLQHGAVVIPKSTHPERIRNNIDLFSFAIQDQVKKRGVSCVRFASVDIFDGVVIINTPSIWRLIITLGHGCLGRILCRW
jgi:hypothetical protein